MLSFRQPLNFVLRKIAAGDDEFSGVSPFMAAVCPQAWDTGPSPYGKTDSDIKGIGMSRPLIFALNGLNLSGRGLFHPAKSTLPAEGGTLYGITGTDVKDKPIPKPIIFGLKGGLFHPTIPNPAETPGLSYKIQGITRDEVGTAVGGYTVYLFNVTSGAPILVQTTISDGSGLYSFTVDSGQSYWVVDYKAGTPDKTGATNNTLTGVLS